LEDAQCSKHGKLSKTILNIENSAELAVCAAWINTIVRARYKPRYSAEAEA